MNNALFAFAFFGLGVVVGVAGISYSFYRRLQNRQHAHDFMLGVLQSNPELMDDVVKHYRRLREEQRLRELGTKILNNDSSFQNALSRAHERRTNDVT
jgi:hypothetical protein